MTLMASISFESSHWVVPVLLSVAVILAALVWSYRAGTGTGAGSVRGWCFLLKALGVVALGLCLLEPRWNSQRARPGANIYAVVADNSQGLNIRDLGSDQSRGEQLKEWLDPGKSTWPQRLEANFEVRRYVFDARLQNVRSFGELDFQGKSSAIGGALRTVAERFKGRPLAGILLFTDGNATDLTGNVPTIPGLPPVYPVVVGSAKPARDLALQQVTATQTAFEDAPVTVQSEIQATGLSGATVMARLVDQDGKQVVEQRLTVRGDRESTPFRAQLKPERPGVSFYRLQVELSGAGGNPAAAEATEVNNARVLAVDRGRGPYRILYVSGRPNWEFKFLNRALSEDAQLQMVGLIRVAKREPKFDFRGRGGETSNPLFRGFGDQGRETTERYDQPVMTRLNTRDEVELSGGFPKTAEELYGYHAVILDDLEAEFFQPAQMALLPKYVSERGGSVLVLGGMESFQQGKYHRTPLGDILPVYLDRADEPAVPAGGWKFELSREGWLQSWARLRDNEGDERGRIEAMPPFSVVNQVGAIKPGASVMATISSAEGSPQPALVMQRFGRGRSAALLVGDVWRWGMRSPEAHADMDKAWRQLIRSLVADVPNRVEMSAEPLPEDPNGAMKLQVRVRDQAFQPLDNASVSVEVRTLMATNVPAGAAPLRLVAEAVGSEPGVYEAVYVPRLAAGYHALAYVTNSVGAEVGRAEAGWSTDLAAEEFRSLSPNLGLLEDLARKTGGELVPASAVGGFVDTLPSRSAPVMEPWSRPLWHTPIWFAIAVALFLAEWGLRRWKGLA